MEELIILMKEDLEILQNSQSSETSAVQTPDRRSPEVFSGGKAPQSFITFGYPRKEVKEVKEFKKQERWTEDNFFENMEKISYVKTFKDGSKKKVVNPPSRALWPLVEGKEYVKVQDLCADYDIDCIRDESPDQNEYKPFVFMVLENMSE